MEEVLTAGNLRDSSEQQLKPDLRPNAGCGGESVESLTAVSHSGSYLALICLGKILTRRQKIESKVTRLLEKQSNINEHELRESHASGLSECGTGTSYSVDFA